MNELHAPYQRKIRKRTIILTFFFFLWFFGLILRLIQLQVIEHSRLQAAVVKQNQLRQEIYPERGAIFDRRGEVLARSLPSLSVVYLPSDDELAADQFARILKLRKILELTDQDLKRIKIRIEKGDPFIYVKRKISENKAESAKALGLSGIYFQEEKKRYYPNSLLAAHVLGGVDIDDKGLAGAELQHNSRLAGVPGESLILRDAKKRRYHWEVLKQPIPGKDIILTIDNTIQYIAERELEKAVQAQRAAWGTVVVSHPASGEILAMASVPAYDPNNYSSSAQEARPNRAVQYNFEPGSTFKIVTAATARELGLVGFSDIFDCSSGHIQVAGWTISDHKKMGVLTFPEVIIHSSNVGTVKVSLRLGADNLCRMIKTFHFGEKTGIDLPGEENGIFHPLQKWSRSSLASHAIGYGISVTAVQMLQAMNIIANSGYLVRFRMIRDAFDLSPSFEPTPPLGEKIVSEKTASDLILTIFEDVVLKGTGQAAQIDGFSVAGKTGTAQKLEPTGGYTSSKHLATFVGFVPAKNPVISMIVVIDEPKVGLHYGGQVAAPVFREIARRVLLYLRQPPQIDPEKRIVTAELRSKSQR